MLSSAASSAPLAFNFAPGHHLIPGDAWHPIHLDRLLGGCRAMGEPVSLNSLSPQELLEVQQSLQQELRTMSQNALTLQSTASKFAAAGQAVEYLQEQKQGGLDN